MSEPVLRLDQVTKSFGLTEVIKGVNLGINAGERHAIIGPNGAGKSTLFHIISGKYPASTGQVFLKGTDITAKPSYEINRLGLSRSFQITNIFPKLSVFENVRCAVLWSLQFKYSFWRIVDRQRRLNERTQAVLDAIGLSRRQSQPAGTLSYAEQRALEIGIAIAGDADVVLLDEPTAGMSHSETEDAVALIRKVSENKTLVIVEHDMSVVFGLADRISVLVYGEVIASDVPERIRENTAVQEAYLGVEVN